jgi:succinate dehydrogenase / fumarate reductase cytochrome b subunit
MTTTFEAPPIYRTTIGKKVLVAVTGILGLGFILGHVVGNLHAFEGRNQLNSYGEWLRTIGEPALPRSLFLWIMRVVLLGSLIIHVTLTAQLAMRSRASRKSRYGDHDIVQASYASRTMRWGGVAILLFLVWHLMDLSWGVPSHFIRGDVYGNVVQSFNNVPNTLVYLVASFALGMHLYHGTWSVFQTLGVNRSRWDGPIRKLALAIALFVGIGFAAVPLAVLAGVIS